MCDIIINIFFLSEKIYHHKTNTGNSYNQY